MLVARRSSLRCWSLHSRGVFKPWRGRERMRGAQCESAPCKPVSSEGQGGWPQYQGFEPLCVQPAAARRQAGPCSVSGPSSVLPATPILS